MEFLSTFLFVFLLMGLLLVKGILKNFGKPSSALPPEGEPEVSFPDVFRRLMEGELSQDYETVEEEQVPDSGSVCRETEEVLSSASVKQGDTLTDAAKAKVHQPARQQPLPLHTKEELRRAVLYAEILRRKY